MANTSSVALVSSAWTLISSGANSGVISLMTTGDVLILENSSLPAATVGYGHPLTVYERSIGFNVGAGQNVYGRSIGTNAVVSVTED